MTSHHPTWIDQFAFLRSSEIAGGEKVRANRLGCFANKISGTSNHQHSTLLPRSGRVGMFTDDYYTCREPIAACVHQLVFRHFRTRCFCFTTCGLMCGETSVVRHGTLDPHTFRMMIPEKKLMLLALKVNKNLQLSLRASF